MVDLVSRGKLGLALAAALVALAGTAQAQSMTANSASFNAGYGRTTDQENQPVNVALRDANGNLVIVDGVIQTGEESSVFAKIGAGGAVDTVSGVGSSSSASAVANNLVVTQGNDNTVIVNSTQTNSGNVTASSSVNGGVNNDH